MAALALADRQPLGVAAAHGDDRLGHQRVMDDDVGFHQQPLGAQRQQVFGAGPGADQRDMAVARLRRRRSSSAPPARRLVGMADLHGARRRAAEEVVPEAAARAALRQQPLGGVAAANAASAASAPSDGDSSWSILARIIWASTGPAPSVPIATQTGARLTIAGVKKSQSSGRSTALTGMPSGAGVVGDAAVERVVAARRENQAPRRRGAAA